MRATESRTGGVRGHPRKGREGWRASGGLKRLALGQGASAGARNSAGDGGRSREGQGEDVFGLEEVNKNASQGFVRDGSQQQGSDSPVSAGGGEAPEQDADPDPLVPISKKWPTILEWSATDSEGEADGCGAQGGGDPSPHLRCTFPLACALGPVGREGR
ncbi:hypothetical protein NDU88_003912 [Pleurodeles waltl]|uniref:Uncharacterized protein n=1 Tax=Pleurodeles waltl TaxID=8319 RepID=A0AAV7T614_PLEWA|nr:hypothetical protein NDU88_003912 [Pleurodeles waltl]